jgi:hypothetical protein
MRTTVGRGRRRGALAALGGDSGVAMMSSILLVLIMASLSMVVLALVMAQTRPTEFARKNTRTIFAAEAGVEAALSQIRSAGGTPDFTGTIYGDLTQLPCALQGTVADAAGDLSYQVQVRYYKDDPAGQSETWLTANKMACKPATQPIYAYITAQGFAETTPRLSADDADRSLSTVYQFNTTNTNIAGGRIYTFGDAFCLRADGLTAGSTITYKAKSECGTDDDHELWLYDVDYKLKLAVTTIPGSTALCITGPVTAGGTGEKVTLQPCKTDAARWNQLWSWDTGARWQGQKQDLTNYSGSCLYAGTTTNSAVGNAKLHVGSCASDQPWGSFNPDPAVGAGAASADTIQIVNYLEFGRCFDVTDQQVGKAFMIVYPCKQDPSGGARLNWNHKWYYSEPATGSSVRENQQIYVKENNADSGKKCLQSPGASGTYVTLVTCSASAPNQQWDRYKDTGNAATSYTFVDYLGRCVGLSEDKYNDAWSKIVVTSCSGEADQKWNAPAQKSDAQIGDYVEGARG